MPRSVVDKLLDEYIETSSKGKNRDLFLKIIQDKSHREEFSKQFFQFNKSDIKYLLDNPDLLNLMIEKMKKEFPDVSENRLREALLFSHEEKPVKEESFLSNAYHNSDEGIFTAGEHNTKKWLETIKELYVKEKDGEIRSKALQDVTAGWAPNEVLDFKNWLKFYEGDNHLKYKTAQSKMYGYPGYALPIRPDDPEEVSMTDINDIKDQVASQLTPKEKKQIIETHRRKIISRLDATEKLLRSDDGHLFAGKELESLIDTIYNLKKKISLVNKLSTSTKLYEDMIVKEANVLVKNGYSDAGDFLYVLAAPATEPAKPETASDDKPLPTPTPPAPPAQGSGSAGGLPASIPAQPNAPEAPKNENSPASVAGINTSTPAPDSSTPDTTTTATPPSPTPPVEVISTPFPVEKKEESKGIKSFLSKLDTMGITSKDNNSSDDDLFVSDEDLLDSEELVVEAQAAPAPPAAPPPAAPPAPIPAAPQEELLEVEEPVEVSPAPVTKANAPPAASDKLEVFDNKINSLFANVTVEDIIKKLEDLSKIFKVREIPRQLALVDMMLDSLGLASYFPDLSEATNKALESNNYISTRIDNMLSKLHGAIKTKEIDLYGEQPNITPEVDAVRQQLESVENKEKLKREVRKKQDLDEAVQLSKESPEVEIDEDLVTPPAPAPVAPVPAAPVPAPAPVTPAV